VIITNPEFRRITPYGQRSRNHCIAVEVLDWINLSELFNKFPSIAARYLAECSGLLAYALDFGEHWVPIADLLKGAYLLPKRFGISLDLHSSLNVWHTLYLCTGISNNRIQATRAICLSFDSSQIRGNRDYFAAMLHAEM
jgi:hypothetical protein